MASSSSSNRKRFDVFISFRGEDTRRNFVSHLEKELERKAINTFKDIDKLLAGNIISNEIIMAIEESRFAVVVISRNYASSGWCLEELTKIMECEAMGMLTVIPIHYEVDPSDVRRQKGDFAEAFERHEHRQSPEKIQKWREALRKVANISGLDSRISPDDATLVSQIVEDISKRLFSMVPRDFDDIIGMDAHLKALDPLVNMGSDDEVRMIGIWGTGGVGKTTIAEILYDKCKRQFRFHCFMRNVKKIYSEQGLEKLQRHFLSKILHDEKLLSMNIEIHSGAIKSRLCDKKVLAILDDVDGLDQLQALAEQTSWFGPGSRIIITTRERALLFAFGIELVYNVKCLDDADALRLFNHFAFGGNQASDDFMKLSLRVLDIVKGLPSAIKVLGKTLRGKKIQEWTAIVDRLEENSRSTVTEYSGKASERHEDRPSAGKVQTRREAPTKVARLTGVDSQNSADAATLVSEIVEDISKRFSSVVPRDFGDIIGMDAHLEVLDPLLNMRSDNEVRVIGIWGKGGVGKTSIAQCLYNMYKGQFQFHCFMHNIKKIDSEKGLEMLQRQFLSKILHDEKLLSKTIEIDSYMIKSRLCDKKVLAILDDVDDLDQLQALAAHTSWFGIGSRIIITTRERGLFIAHRIELQYEVKCLDDDAALRLFNHFAVGEKKVSDDFMKLSFRALKLVKGLPLAIRALGNSLRGRNIEEWKAALRRLETSPETAKEFFGKAFERHEDRRSGEKVQKRREALTKVVSIIGVDSQNSPNDATLISKNVEDISSWLFSKVPRVFDDIIGMDAHLEALNPLLNMGSNDEVRMIGIWGTGGVGKTTIAEILYDKYKCQFPFHCFMRNIKKIYSGQGLEKLQRHFLSKILHDEKLLSMNIEIHSGEIKSRLCDKRVLAILDDVDDLNQLQALAEHISWFGLGSRIIITTREKHLFLAHRIELVYEVKCLDDADALELFNHFAFGENKVSDDFMELSFRAVELVKGLPLVIKVLGKTLRGKKIEEWTAAVRRLEETSRRTVTESLKRRYEALDAQSKNVFLTIACLFSGKHVSHLSQLLHDGEESMVISHSLKMLAEKALIDISNDERVIVHDSIQEMAKEIVRQESIDKPEKRRFLCNPNDIYNVLADEMGTDEIEGISLDMSKIERFPMGSKGFENMQNLKFLVIRNTSCYRGDLLQLCAAVNHLPQRLKLLDWEHCPLTTLPPTFDAECLVELRLSHSELEKLSERTLFLGKLRKLELQSCLHLKEIPKLPENIVELNLSGTNIREMPELPNLPTLKILDFSESQMLMKIPNTIGNLTSLKDLDFSGCEELRIIPDEIGNLASLETLRLQRCHMLIEIPSSIGNLTALRDLDFSRCAELRIIPDTIGNLVSLETLNLAGCSMLLEIPTRIGDLTALKKLDLSRCENLRSIPDAIGSMITLKELKLRGCQMLLEIPSTIGNLPFVEDLDLWNCESIKRIPDFEGSFIALRAIILRNCKMLSEISSTIGNFTTLRELEVVNCENLKSIPSTIGDLISLEDLSLSGCAMLKEIPNTIGDLRTLKHLCIENCKKLGSIPHTIGKMTLFLERLVLDGCTMLTEIPSTIGNLRALKDLHIKGCENLGNIPDTIGNLVTLERLVLDGCTMLMEIPSTIGNLRGLKDLHIKNCEKLGGIPDTIGNLMALERLVLNGCTMLMEIPSPIGNLSALKLLCIENCENFCHISSTIGSLTALERLILGGCTMLEEIPSTIGNLRALKHLRIENCENLRCIPDTIGNLTGLLTLKLLGCKLISMIPHSIRNLTALESLRLPGHEMLLEMPSSIGNLKEL